MFFGHEPRNENFPSGSVIASDGKMFEYSRRLVENFRLQNTKCWGMSALLKTQNLQNQAKYHDNNSRPLIELQIGEKVIMLDSKTWKPAVLMKKYEETSFIVKTENGKTFRRNRQHLGQIADTNGSDDDTILISDGDEENSIEQEDTENGKKKEWAHAMR